jgi:hypothetical protein
VAEERNAAVLELRTLLLESESESIVGGSKKAEKSENGRVCPYWLEYATAVALEALLSNWDTGSC